MKTERRLLLSALFLVFAFPAIGSAWDSYGIDEGKLNVSGDGYIIGISNDGEDMMLLRILDTGNVSTFEVQHRIYLDAVNLAEEMELEDFSSVYGDD
jgi:hypothetical protein